MLPFFVSLFNDNVFSFMAGAFQPPSNFMIILRETVLRLLQGLPAALLVQKKLPVVP